MTKAGAQQVLPGLHSREHQFFKLEKVSLSRVTRLSLNTLKCGSKRDERYDSTGLLSDKWQLIYRYCTRVVEYTPNWVDGQ
jgi:hypothetical protein